MSAMGIKVIRKPAFRNTAPAFQRAVIKHLLTEALLFHSDRGIQYAAVDFTKVLGANPLITRSMSHRLRRHSHFGQMNILEFEQQFFKPKQAA